MKPPRLEISGRGGQTLFFSIASPEATNLSLNFQFKIGMHEDVKSYVLLQ